MAAQDPLSEMADIHLPDSVSPWPPALGWWLLGAVLLALVYYLTRATVKSYIRRKRLRNALAELENSLQRYREKSAFDDTRNGAGLEYLGDINSILRRVALTRYSQSRIAPLNGNQWLDFLDSVDECEDFSHGPGKALGEALYRKTFDADAEALYRLCRRWIENRYRGKETRGNRSADVEATA